MKPKRRNHAVGVTSNRLRHGHARKGAVTVTYWTWRNMMKRCIRISSSGTNFRYIAMGISVCKRWWVFDNFLADMGERPEGMSIDRINNRKGYSPANCRWATKTEQARNASNSKRWVVDGKLYESLSDAENGFGMSKQTILARIKKKVPGFYSRSVYK